MCCVNGCGCGWLSECLHNVLQMFFCLLTCSGHFVQFSFVLFSDCYKITHPQALGTSWWKYSIHWFHIYHLLRLGRAAFLYQSAPTGSATLPAPGKGFGCLCPGAGLLCAAVTWGEMLWNKLCEICVEPWQGLPLEEPGRVVRGTAAMLQICLTMFLPPGPWPSDWNS